MYLLTYFASIYRKVDCWVHVATVVVVVLHIAGLQDPDTAELELEQWDWEEHPGLHTVALAYFDMQSLCPVEPDSILPVVVMDPQLAEELHMEYTVVEELEDNDGSL
jgi:hypothetical protein